MTKPSKTTIRYAAKQAYQLWITRGLDTSRNAGLACLVYYAADNAEEARNGIKHAKVKVYYDIKDGEHTYLSFTNVTVPKAWNSL